MNSFYQSLLFYLLLLPQNVLAGEFLTDTPVTLSYEEVKMDAFSSVKKKDTSTNMRAPGFEADIGLYPDLQSHFVVYASSVIKPHKSTQYGWGDTELCLKYRFIHETDVIPQVAFYPRVTVPSGDTSRGIGNKKAIEKIPLWAQKSWGPWKLSGGGGYAFVQNQNKADYVYGGALLRRDCGEGLTLGGELYAKGTESSSDRAHLIANFGGNYTISNHYFMLFSAGHSIAGEKNLVAFFGLGLKP